MNPKQDGTNTYAAARSASNTFRVPRPLRAILLIAFGAASICAQTPFNLGNIVVNPGGLPADPTPPPAPFQTPVRFQVINMDQVDDAYPAYGYYALARPTVAAGLERGMVVCFTGDSGTRWWNDGTATRVRDLTTSLLSKGFAVVQVRWVSNWHAAKKNDPALPGVARLACQPATIIKYIHESVFPQFDQLEHGVGEAGFCLIGNSGGASQISYALSHYGLDSIVDVLVPTGGPPHADMTRSIRAPMTGSDSDYWLDDSTMITFDKSFGIFQNGPALNNDQSALWTARWDAASIGKGGSDYVHPRTRINFILGENDSRAAGGSGMIPIYKGYYDTLKNASPISPFIRNVVFPVGTGHNVLGTAAGVTAVEAAIDEASPGGGDIDPPSAPTLTSPGSTTTDTTPTFQWSSVNDPSTPVTYRLQVDNNPDFSSPKLNISSLSSNSYTIPAGSALSTGTTYSWRVRAVDGAGNVGPWSFPARTVTISP